MNKQLSLNSNKKTFIASKFFYPIILVSLFVNLSCSAKSLNEYLAQGSVDEGVVDFSYKLSTPNYSDEDAFSLGVLQFFEGLENLMQSLYKYGLHSEVGRQANLPFLRLPIPKNPNPQIVTASKLSVMMDQFHSDMEKANLALSKVKDSGFNVPLDLGKIRLDINQDKKYEESESFRQIYLSYNRQAGNLFKKDEAFIVNFDLGDAYWLKGYTHLLMAIIDTIRAHDGSKVFEYSAHLFFENVDTQMGQLLNNDMTSGMYMTWVDLFVGVHVMNMEVTAPERLKRAHHHFLKTIDTSRKMWRHIEIETDNLNEWIPNAYQISVTGVEIPEDMISGWMEFLSEFEAVLKGEKLIPHWRFKSHIGINLKKVMFEPRPFDLFLWIQGSAAIPYLESGTMSSKQTWRRITRTFKGNFVGFAIWVN
jgi:hypothetical protein